MNSACTYIKCIERIEINRTLLIDCEVNNETITTRGQTTHFMEIGIIGGAGHVGLPTGLILADSGHKVSLIDKNEEQLETIESGTVPFFEPGAEETLADVLSKNKLSTTTNLDRIEACDAIIVVVGTPIDEHKNPQMENFFGLVDNIIDRLQQGQLLIFRSTLYPGTTANVRDQLENSDFDVGNDVYLAFAPERIAQHRAMEELVELPQLIGAFDDASEAQTKKVFNFVESDCFRLTPTEAELGKLYTNMWRYLTFAAANEFQIIAETFAEQHEVNIHKILDKTSANYPRFNVPSPGSNVGGPCLTKDGWFLVDNIPFNELVSTSFQINEGMPARIISRMSDMKPDPKKVGILGMTFKKNSDDIRNSVSFKLRKQLRRKGFRNVVEIEPNLTSYDDWSKLQNCDWIILMTPHDEFKNLQKIKRTVKNEDCLYCDLWGYWDEIKYESDNGYFRGKEVPGKQSPQGVKK